MGQLQPYINISSETIDTEVGPVAPGDEFVSEDGYQDYITELLMSAKIKPRLPDPSMASSGQPFSWEDHV